MNNKKIKSLKLVVFILCFSGTSFLYALDKKLSCNVQSTYTYRYVLSSETSVEKNEGIAFVTIEEIKKFKAISISSNISDLDNLLTATRHPNLESFIDESNFNRWDIQSNLVNLKEGKRYERITKIIIDRNSGEIIIQASSIVDKLIRSELSAFGTCSKVDSKKRRF